MHPALLTPEAIAVGVEVAGLLWVGDPSGSPVVGLHATPTITTANRMVRRYQASLHLRSIQSIGGDDPPEVAQAQAYPAPGSSC